MPHRLLGRAAQLDELFQDDRLEAQLARVGAGGRNEMQRAGDAVEEPFLRRIKFFEYVFDEAFFGVERRLGDDGAAFVLPAAGDTRVLPGFKGVTAIA